MSYHVRRSLLFSCLLLAVGSFVLPLAGASAAVSQPVALTSGWQFAEDPSDQGVGEGWAFGGDKAPWSDVRVPHVVDPQPLESSFSGTVSWYRIAFQGPPTAVGTGWGLRFEQVRRTARVWLNGRPLGGHRDPYTPFTLPALGLVPGKVNTLVVRVDSRRGSQPREGWWNWGGITRPVWLEPRGAVVLHDVGLLPERVCAGRSCRWRLLADGWLENRSAQAQRPRVAVRLESPDGTVTTAVSPARRMRSGERVRMRFRFGVRGTPKLWSPERPSLYDATVTTSVSGRPVQVDTEHVGLRWVRVRNGMLTLNGKTLDLRGASIQEDVPGRGPALTFNDIERMIAELKTLGANVTRAHYLLNDFLLDRLDQEGILVWSQAPVYHRDVRLRTAAQRAYELGVLRDTIKAARRHPSVITHSVANELSPNPDRVTTTGQWLRDAAATTRDLDPTLPVSVDLLSYPRIAKQRTYDHFDMLGINSYYGWYEGKSHRSTKNLSDLAPYLRGMHARYPGKALVVTEFGAEATEDGPAAAKQTYAFQEQYLKRNLAIIDRLGFMGGAIYWTVREFAVKPNWDGGAHPLERDGIHNKGLISYDGVPKPAWNVARAAFRSTPLYRENGQPAARAALARPSSSAGEATFMLGVMTLIIGILGFDVWCVRGIWLAVRRDRHGHRQAEVIALRRVA